MSISVLINGNIDKPQEKSRYCPGVGGDPIAFPFFPLETPYPPSSSSKTTPERKIHELT